jgi:histidinol-phosphate aminotransferase
LLIQQLPNLIVLRRCPNRSRSLARASAFASAEIVAGLHKVRDSYNLDRLSIAAGTAALKDLAWMKRNAARIQRSRQRLASSLKRLGYQVYSSHANFILARQPDKNLRPIYEELKRRKILVRYFDVPGLRDCLRITVGTPKEVRALLNELAAIQFNCRINWLGRRSWVMGN